MEKTKVTREVRDLTQELDSELEVNPDRLCHFFLTDHWVIIVLITHFWCF